MMLIDGHVRLATPENEMDAYDKFLEHYGQFKGYETGEDLIADMDRDGVNMSVLLHGNNAHRLALVERYPQRLIAFAGVSMQALRDDLEKTLAKARENISRGCRGFGELTPFGQGFALDDPALGALIELAIELDVPIHFECTVTVGEYVPGRISTSLYDFERIAIRYPKLKMILSSWGGGLCLFEMIPEVPETLANVYYSTGSPVDDFDIGLMLRTVPKVCYPRKLLYGSVAPLRSRHTEAYLNADAPKEVIQAVMGYNIAALIGLNINQEDSANEPAEA